MDPYAATFEHFQQNKAAGVKLIYTSHPYWPLPEPATSRGHHGHRLSLSVLDSSFNPPTNAHLALANLPASTAPDDTTIYPQTFDAKLLLFSTKNADKTLKPGDATLSQRLQMMVLLARELQGQSEDHGSHNIAVAICQEPTFVGKSASLKQFFQDRITALSSSANVHLTFLVGFDTLERLFATRYYGSETNMKEALRQFLSTSGDNSRIICVYRAPGASYSLVDTSALEAAREYIKSGAVVLTNIGEGERTLSSSEVREMVRNASDTWQQKVSKLVATYIKENQLYTQLAGSY